MADTSTAHIDILRDIAHSEADIGATMADMHETVISTRASLEQTYKLLREMNRPPQLAAVLPLRSA